MSPPYLSYSPSSARTDITACLLVNTERHGRTEIFNIKCKQKLAQMTNWTYVKLLPVLGDKAPIGQFLAIIIFAVMLTNQ